jgi:hypothetical protein
MSVNSDLHASKKPKDKKNDSNVSVTECEGVMHVRQGNQHNSGQTSL